MKGASENMSRPVALITGAAGGLGRALAREFLRNGWAVVAAAHRPESWEAEPLEPSAAGTEIESAGGVRSIFQDAACSRLLSPKEELAQMLVEPMPSGGDHEQEPLAALIAHKLPWPDDSMVVICLPGMGSLALKSSLPFRHQPFRPAEQFKTRLKVAGE